jgi:hypothetical protein
VERGGHRVQVSAWAAGDTIAPVGVHGRALLLCVTLLTGCASTPKKVAGVPPSGADVSADMLAEIDRAVCIGSEIYAQDSVSALATDLMLANVKDPRGQGLRGWIAVRESSAVIASGGWLVYFYDSGHPPKLRYLARINTARHEASFEPLSPPEEPTPKLLAAIRARQTAIDALGMPEGPINPVVLPADFVGQRGFLVYLLLGTTEPKLAVFGKHHRVIVSEDGMRVEQMTALTKTNIAVPYGKDVKAGETPASLMITHLLSETPTEIHVFVGLQHRLPVYVATPSRRIFAVEGTRVRFVPNESDGPSFVIRPSVCTK